MRKNNFYSYICIFLFLLLPAGGLFADTGESLPANAAVVVDSSNSTIFSKNPDLRLPPASTTKLVTAMVVLDRMNPDETITVSPKAARTHTVAPKIRRNERISVRDLLHLALMSSSNSAAVALAEGTAGSEEEFAVMMNLKAASIGADNSRFANASGLPGGEQYTTANDLTLILKEALSYPLIKEILGKKQIVVQTSKRTLSVENTDKLLWVTDNIVGGKTGFTCNAKHCFVGAIETERGILYTAVLGAPSRNSMWLSAGNLMGIGEYATFKKLVSPKHIKTGRKKYSGKKKYTAKSKKKTVKAAVASNKKKSNAKTLAKGGNKKPRESLQVRKKQDSSYYGLIYGKPRQKQKVGGGDRI